MRPDRGPDPATEATVERAPAVGREAAGELERLLELSVRLSSGLELGPILDATLAAAAAIGGTAMGGLCLLDDDGPGPGTSLGFEDDLLARLGGVAQLCLQRGAPVVVADTDLDPLAHEAHEAALGRFRALHAVPVRGPSGRLLGVLTLYFHQPGRLSDRAGELLQRCAAIAGGPIENALQHRRTLRELAERRAGEAARGAEAERLSLGLTAAGVCAWEWHTETGDVIWSHSIYEMLGLQPGDPTPNAEQWYDLLHPDDVAEVRRVADLCVRTGTSFYVEYRVRRIDGTYRWIAARGDIVHSAVPGPPRFVGALHDITARRCAEAALRDGEERQRKLADNLPSGFIYQVIEQPDATRRFTYVSRGIEAITGKTPADIMANPVGLEAWVLAEDLPLVVRSEAAAFRVGEHFECQFRIHGRDGVRWLHCRSAPRRLSDGTNAWDGIALDVTERVQAEEALRASEARYRTLFNSIDEGFCVIEVLFDGDHAVDYRFLEVNPAFEKHTGLRDAAGKTMRELAPDHDAHWFKVYGEVARTGRATRFVNEARALGQRWFDVYAFKLGEGDRVAILFTDISARLSAEAERERLVEELRDADRKKDDFIALLAHELRNPLAPLRTGLQVMRLAGGNVDVVARTRAMMDRQLSHMVRLIDDLMDVSRISRNKLELRRERVLLADVIGSAVETARPQIEAANHDLQVSLPAGPVFLDADLTRLAQVFSNLLTNSAKYTAPGGRIRLDARRLGGEIVVTVRDNGIGIPAYALSSIFDMFSQIDRTLERTAGGLGLGLALVKGLVEMHGGSVTAASEGEGRGSVFTVRLPVLADRAHADEADAGAVPSGPACRVLVVDDNQDGAGAMAMMLEMLGHEVRTAHDGVEAIEAAEDFRPHVILMDVGMPRLNGLDATRRIREQAWGKDIAIVALTGWGQEADRARSKAAGCDCHLVKPVNLEDLERLLEQYAGGRAHKPV
ncbi:PAS domain-containing protein [Nannocystis punicea]|uniref:histidine kinase n=1 Tax=Nannocystis punicea TaxID=2995304 RepID=A0ABY7HJE5_9BACT|nr:PAS domain-containing protein [Nannocystis poenicansa]WAS99346.1 PAS domain-containing protein [Nannocystis poenicansa]